MKQIDVDDELYHYIASRTQFIGESASDILRRLLRLPKSPQPFVLVQKNTDNASNEPAKSKNNVNKSQDKVIKNLESVLNSSLFLQEKKAVKRFLQVLGALHKGNPSLFAKATEQVQGSERVYFARDEATILATGSGVKAQQIPRAPFWVITNNNTERKGIILSALMAEMALPEALIERTRTFFV